MINCPLSGDARTRAADLYQAFATAVWSRLCGRYRGVDEQAVADAVVRAVLDLAADPVSGAPHPVDRALLNRARQWLRVTLRGDGRRKRREEQYSAASGRDAGPSPADAVADRELADRVRSVVARTEPERRALDLWLNGVNDPTEIAGRLGVTAAEAVAVLARLRQRVRRERSTRGGEEDDP